MGAWRFLLLSESPAIHSEVFFIWHIVGVSPDSWASDCHTLRSYLKIGKDENYSGQRGPPRDGRLQLSSG